MNFTFGCDPEFMLVYRDELKSATEILPHKQKAIVQNSHEYYFDNVLAEIAIFPANSKESVIQNIGQALKNLSVIINPVKFVIRASANYPQKTLKSIDAKIAGCKPEWDVYSLQQILPPNKDIDLKDGYYQFKTSFRSAGGHIHIGSDNLSYPDDIFNVIRMMDLFIGIPSIFLDTDETSKNRRRIYGLAGSHRTPKYGLEYRPLGNFWFSSPDFVSLIYDLTSFVIYFVKNNFHEKFWSIDESLLEEDPTLAYQCFGYDAKLLQKCINTCNKKQAEKFMMIVENYLPSKIFKEIERLKEKPLQNPYEAWNLN